jgi:hypothetical protein
MAFAVLSGIVRSGGRYFYCDALGLLPYDPCAEASSDTHCESPLGTLSERRADCCEVVALAAMPQVAQAADPTIAPAPWVGLLPPRPFTGPTSFAAPWGVDRELEKWRPPPRAPNEARARLMVFLI